MRIFVFFALSWKLLPGLLQDFISLSTPSSPLKRSLFSPSFFEKTQFSSLTFLPLWPLFALFGQNVDARDIKYSRTSDISSFTHTKTHLLYYTHNVCCYSTNRVRRRPQGHQGSGTNALFFSLSFSGKDLSLFQSARARFSLNSLFPYPTLKDTKITREKKRDRSETMETSLSRAREREIRVYAYRMKNSARASSFFLTQSARAIIRSRRYSLIDWDDGCSHQSARERKSFQTISFFFRFATSGS